MILAEMTSPEVDALSRDIVVLIPVASCEQHSLHLPVFTDSLIGGEVARRVHERVPDDVLATFPDSMVIKLDSAYHGHNSPRFTDEGVLLSLSFKGVNDCFFSWDTILQVIFHVGSPGDPKKAGDDPSPSPGLRLVK